MTGPRPRRWTRDEYYRMAYPVIFGPEERLELIHGEIHLRSQSRLRPFTREEYYRLADAGILKPGERTELIKGVIFSKMSPQRTPHTVGLRAVVEVLRSAFGAGHEVRYQLPLTLPDGSEPEPDVLVLPGSFRDYEDHHPIPADVMLLVEVADTSIRFDRGHRARLYAQVGIVEYWIVNLAKR